MRYRGLIPFMWMTVVLEQILRYGEGHLKPLIVDSTPPGAYGTGVLLVVAPLVLLWSVLGRRHVRARFAR